MLRSGYAGAERKLLRMSVTIYHNPACGASRNTLALMRATGVEPEVVHYLDTPPSREELVSLIQRMGTSPRDLLREKGTRLRNSVSATPRSATSRSSAR